MAGAPERLLAQRLLFTPPVAEAPEELYAMVDQGAVTRERDGITVRPGSSVTTNTYFGRFPASYWQRWTEVREVRWEADCSGNGEIRLVASDSDGLPRVVHAVSVDAAEHTRRRRDRRAGPVRRRRRPLAGVPHRPGHAGGAARQVDGGRAEAPQADGRRDALVQPGQLLHRHPPRPGRRPGGAGHAGRRVPGRPGQRQGQREPRVPQGRRGAGRQAHLHPAAQPGRRRRLQPWPAGGQHEPRRARERPVHGRRHLAGTGRRVPFEFVRAAHPQAGHRRWPDAAPAAPGPAARGRRDGRPEPPCGRHRRRRLAGQRQHDRVRPAEAGPAREVRPLRARPSSSRTRASRAATTAGGPA